ncbi:fimbria/pilus outer membrane usher protein [Shigella flexneri]
MTGKVIDCLQQICEPNVDAFWSGGLRYSSRDTGQFNDHVGQTIKIIIAVMKTMSMTLPIITRMILVAKNSFSANMSQSLPEGWGSVSLSTLWRDYWGRSGSSKDYQLSYSNNLRRISYTLAASRL